MADTAGPSLRSTDRDRLRPFATALFAIGIALFAAAQPSHALEVIFDYRMDTRGFFDDPLRCSSEPHKNTSDPWMESSGH